MASDTSTISNLPEAAIAPTAPAEKGFKKWAPLVVMSLALAIIIIDTTILNVSLRAIINDLHTTIQNIQWVITAYTLMLAAFTITGGRLGDLFGRKKMFVLGAIIFAVGSFITSISHTVGVMISGESIIEGIGAALMMPATASLLVSNYKGRERALAFGIWGGIAAASAALGPVLGGWLTTHYTWRWAFRINVVVAALLVLGSLLIKEYRDEEEKPKLDYFGILLSSLGLLSIVFGLIKASDFGWFKAKEQLILFSHTLNFGSLSATPLFIVLGLIILFFFVLWEKRVGQRGGTPLVSLKLFRNQQFLVGTLIVSILTLGLTGLTFSSPIFFQAVKNLDAFHTGLALLPMSLSILVAAPFSAFISKYVSPKLLIQVGLVLATISFWVMRMSLHVTASQWALAPGFVVFGLGMGLIMAQANNITLSAVSIQESGEASGVTNTFRQIGSTLGAAIMGTILLTALASNLTTGINNSSVITGNFKSVINSSLSGQTSNIEFGSGPTNQGSLPQAVREEITNISHQATTDASRTTLTYGGLILILGILMSFWLPGGQDIETEQSVAESHLNSEKVIPVRRARFGALLVAVVVAALGLAVGYYWGKKAHQSNTSNNPVSTVAGTAFPPASAPTSTASGFLSNTSSPATTIPNQIRGGSVLGNSTASVGDKTYANASLRFKLTIPEDWKINPKASDQVIFASPVGLRFSVQSDIASSQDWQGLKTFLEAQSGLTGIYETTFNGTSAYAFSIAGPFQQGLALLTNGRQYYLLGPNLQHSPLTSFQTY